MADRREEEHVPLFHGRIDEKFAEWEIDVKLWEAEFKEDDRDRLGPKLYRRGLHGQPKIIVKTKLGTQDVSQFTVDNIIQCLKDMVMENYRKSWDKWHWITILMCAKERRRASRTISSVKRFSQLL